jgi:ATP-dependent Clp protease ATP-binding subunit ClpC
MTPSVDTHTKRAALARFSHSFGDTGSKATATIAYLSFVTAITSAALGSWDIGLVLTGFGLGAWMWHIWYKRYLSIMPPDGERVEGRLSRDVLGLLKRGETITPRTLWDDLTPNWQAIFLLNRLFLHPGTLADGISTTEADVIGVMSRADELSGDRTNLIEVGHIIAALMLTSEPILQLMKTQKMQPDDITNVLRWLERGIESMHMEPPYFGGIGRDWATGFTPKLSQYGVNISMSIQNHGAHFGSLTQAPGVASLRNALSQGASAVALIGDPGSGKTSHVYALAQLLLAESKDPKLQHRQLIGLDAASIISNARQPGELEYIVMMLIHEASHAGNIILFFDNAQLFLKDGHGSFDASRLLLPVAQSSALQIVLAMTPRDMQELKANNATFASAMSQVILKEPDQERTEHILQDTALKLEGQHKALITLSAVKEAYSLSNRYITDRAHPGKGINLLTQSLPYAEQGIVDAATIRRTIEETQGIKLSAVTQAESSQLLNLENEIHKRMINQTRAVNVISNALRRSRAGVANVNRPIGSFLFLGPTGVGKTELAKAVSATYFGSESAMIRLDMSEYQQAEDVKRLLSDGTEESNSLIMAVRTQPYSVVLLDEVEKAHPNILNLLLQLLDEGQLTDTSGRPVSFRDAIIITTSNAGAQQIRAEVEKGRALEEFEQELTDGLINSGQFKPELLNRYDEIVLFRPLTPTELLQVVALMVQDVNKTLAAQNISVSLTEDAAQFIVQAGYDPRLGARPMRRMIQRTIEDTIAQRILQKLVNPGDHVVLSAADIQSR